MLAKEDEKKERGKEKKVKIGHTGVFDWVLNTEVKRDPEPTVCACVGVSSVLDKMIIIVMMTAILVCANQERN